MLRVCHLLPRGDPGAAGLLSAVHGLAAAQRSLEITTAVFHPDHRPGLLQARALQMRVLGNPSQSDSLIVHSHGLWLAPSRASRRLARRGLPSVVAPHGMLDPWAWNRRRRLKQLFWWAGEQRTLQRASCLQALCEAERRAIRALGITAPIALIPNGIALPDPFQAAHAALPPAPWLARGVPAGAPVLLFLGRLHVKKGLQPLLMAWQRLQEGASASGDHPWLVLAGFGDGGALQRQLARSPIPRTALVGPLQGADKASAFAHASAFVLPSFSEGLPMAALEAMSWGLPCLLSAPCNLPEAFGAAAAWEAPPEVGPLLAVLRRWLHSLRRDPSALAAMGSCGRALVADRFSWPQVAAQTAALYGWLLGGGVCPGFVQERQ